MAGLAVQLQVDAGALDQALDRAAASMAAAMGYPPAYCASIIKQALGNCLSLSHLPQLRLARAAAEAARRAQEQALRDAWAGDTDG